MARQRRSLDEQIADLVTQGRTGRGHIMATPDMAAVEAAMIANNAILNEHLTAGAVALENLDETLQGTLADLEGNEEALAAAEARLTAAESRLDALGAEAGSGITYSTHDASGAGKEGDTWRKVDATENIIAEWRFTGTPGAWVSQKVTSEVISNLDVGKLTAGTAVIDDAVAQTIAAGTASFQKADIGNLTVTETTNLADAVARKIAANTAEFIEVSTDRLIAGEAVMDEAVAGKLFADVMGTRKLFANQVVIGDGGNIFPDPNFENPDGWHGTDRVIVQNGGRSANNCLLLAAGDTQRGSYFGQDDRKYQFRVTPGATYLATVFAKADSGAPAESIRIFTKWTNPGGIVGGSWTTPANSGNPQAAPVNGWILVTHEFTVPNNATQCILGLYAQPTCTSRLIFSEPSVREKVTGDLIVDGSVQAKHIEANSITVDKLRVQGSNAIADPNFLDASLNAERLGGTAHAAGTMTFVRDDVSDANVLRFTESSDTQRSFRIGGTNDYIPVVLGDRVKMSVQYRARGNSLPGSTNIRFALYHDSSNKTYVRYVGVGGYREINTSGATWYTWEGEYIITQPDAAFIRPMVQFRNNGYSGEFEIKSPRLEVASRLSVSAPVDSGGTTQELLMGMAPGKSMPSVSFIQSGPAGPPAGYKPAQISSSGGLFLESGFPGGSMSNPPEDTTLTLGMSKATVDGGAGVGRVELIGGAGVYTNQGWSTRRIPIGCLNYYEGTGVLNIRSGTQILSRAVSVPPRARVAVNITLRGYPTVSNQFLQLQAYANNVIFGENTHVSPQSGSGTDCRVRFIYKGSSTYTGNVTFRITGTVVVPTASASNTYNIPAPSSTGAPTIEIWFEDLGDY